MTSNMVVVPNYLQNRITKRLDEICVEYPDVDRSWLENEMLIQALSHDVPPESISIKPTEVK